MMIEIHALGTHFKRLIFRNGVVQSGWAEFFFHFTTEGTCRASYYGHGAFIFGKAPLRKLVCSTGAGVFS